MLVEHWQWLISALHSCCEVWRENERQVGSCRAGRPLRFPFCLSDGEASTRFRCCFCFRRPFSSAHRRYWETTFFFIWCKWGNQYDNPALAIVPVTTSYKSPRSSKVKCPLCVGSFSFLRGPGDCQKTRYFPGFQRLFLFMKQVSEWQCRAVYSISGCVIDWRENSMYKKSNVAQWGLFTIRDKVHKLQKSFCRCVLWCRGGNASGHAAPPQQLCCTLSLVLLSRSVCPLSRPGPSTQTPPAVLQCICPRGLWKTL